MRQGNVGVQIDKEEASAKLSWISLSQTAANTFPSEPRNEFTNMGKTSADGEQSEYIDNVNLSGTGNLEDFVAATAKEEEAIIRKLDYRLLPLVFVLYSLSVLDRSNLGNAKLAGLEDAIDLSGNRYNWLGTLFYIACKPASTRKAPPSLCGYLTLLQTFSFNGPLLAGNNSSLIAGQQL